MQYAATSHGEFEGDSKEIRKRIRRGPRRSPSSRAGSSQRRRRSPAAAHRPAQRPRNNQETAQERPRIGQENGSSGSSISRTAAAAAGAEQDENFYSLRKSLERTCMSESTPPCILRWRLAKKCRGVWRQSGGRSVSARRLAVPRSTAAHQGKVGFLALKQCLSSDDVLLLTVARANKGTAAPQRRGFLLL